MMNNIKRNVDFLKLILRESNRHRRMEKLLHANKDQINAVSKFTLNMLKKKIPLPPPILARLKKHNSVLREKSRIKRLKMTKPQSRADARAKAKARTAEKKKDDHQKTSSKRWWIRYSEMDF